MTIILDNVISLTLHINEAAVQILIYLARIYSFRSKKLANPIHLIYIITPETNEYLESVAVVSVFRLTMAQRNGILKLAMEYNILDKKRFE